MGRKKVKELYPGHAAELARRARRVAATAGANSDPLPGPLAGVWDAVPQCIGGLTVRAVVHYDFVILRKLGSPLLEQIRKAAAGEKSQTAFADEQGYEMVFQFTRPVKEAAAVLAKGVAAFRQAALEEIGMKHNPVDVGLLVAAVEREFVRAFSTLVQYGAPATEGEGAQVFSKPPAEGQTTVSAGG